MTQDPNQGEKPIVTVDSEIKDLIPEYLENVTEELGNVKTAIEGKDFKKAWSIGHNLKGSGDTYGFMPITQFGKQVEILANEENVDGILNEIEKIAEFLKVVEIRYE